MLDGRTTLHWRLDSRATWPGDAANLAGRPVIVLLHGNSMAASIFARQFEGDLPNRYHLAAPDLLGHGKSPRSAQPDVDYTPAGHARLIRADLDRLGAASVLVVGHSYGGHIALALAAQMPAAAGLVLTGMAPVQPGMASLVEVFNPLPGLELLGQERFSEREVAIWAGNCLQGSPHPIPESLADDIRTSDGRHRRVLMANILAGTLMNEVEFLRSTRIPVRFIMGEGERIVNGDRLAARLRDLGLEPAVIIPGAGHTPFWDKSAAFDRAVAAFADLIPDQRATHPLDMAMSTPGA